MERANKVEKLSIAWCDNGMVDSLFVRGLLGVTINLPALGIELGGFHIAIGNQIHNQRQQLIDEWSKTDVDWLLWVDSDVSINPEIVKMLWDIKDKDTKPVVCGIYFVSENPNSPLMTPYPCIFQDNIDGLKSVHPLPVNQVIKIDVAGFGLCLMHRSILDKLKEPYDGVYFDVAVGKHSKGEDVSFFRKLKEQNIPVYAHTGALAQHIKRFVFDVNYYSLWWNSIALDKKSSPLQ